MTYQVPEIFELGAASEIVLGGDFPNLDTTGPEAGDKASEIED